MKIKLLLLFLLSTVFVFGQNNWKTHEKDNYSIKYTDGWKLDTSGQMNSSFYLFSELEQDDSFSENVNLMIQNLTGTGYTLESFVKLSEDQVKTMVPDSKILQSKSVTISGKPGHMMIWYGFVANKNLKFKQYYFIENEKAYVLTLTTLKDTYEKYIEVGEKILNSFKIKE